MNLLAFQKVVVKLELFYIWWQHCCVVGNAYDPSLGVNILHICINAVNNE